MSSYSRQSFSEYGEIQQSGMLTSSSLSGISTSEVVISGE